jgi:hypothetical protein
MMRANFDPDSAYITHPRSGALAYEPLPTETLRSLHIVRSLMTYATDPVELEWLTEREAFLTAHCADCPPRPVRNVEPARRDRPPRREHKYWNWKQGPHNTSGKARS